MNKEEIVEFIDAMIENKRLDMDSILNRLKVNIRVRPNTVDIIEYSLQDKHTGYTTSWSICDQ